MFLTTKHSRFIQETRTIQATSSRDAPSVDLTSPERSSSKMFLIYCTQVSIENADVCSGPKMHSTVAAPWAVHYLQHSASWLSPSANKSGPSTSNKFFAITTYSSDISHMLTTASSLVTHVFVTFHHMKYCWMKDSSVSCWKQNHWN